MKRNTLVACLVMLFVFGCISKAGVVRTRAAFDLSCPEDKVQVTPLSSEVMDRATYGVTGCGKKATYLYTPETGAYLNSPVEGGAPATSASAGP